MPAAALCLILSLCACCASGSYPKAQNISWQSTNFKTVLSWEPTPSNDFSYTVEYSKIGADRERNIHCIRSSATVCDLTSFLTDLKANYTADILSEPPLGVVSDLREPPYSTSPRFCPYKDTDIGKPDFKVEVNEDKTKITLHVTDPLTALFQDDRQLNIRDIFSDDLQYMVTYRKSTSTGKKVHKSKGSVIEVPGLDKDVSYCFTVQAFIPSRTINKQLGEMSHTRCSSDETTSITEVYSVGTIAAAVFLVLLLIGLVAAVVVICYRRRQNAQTSGRDKMPQNV